MGITIEGYKFVALKSSRAINKKRKQGKKPQNANLPEERVRASKVVGMPLLRFLLFLHFPYCVGICSATSAVAAALASADNIPITANTEAGSRSCLKRRLVCLQKRIPKKY